MMVAVIHHLLVLFQSFVSAEATVLQYGMVVVVAQRLEVSLTLVQE
jgi:hypothetical protein